MPELTTLRSIARASPTASSSLASGVRIVSWPRAAALFAIRARTYGSMTSARPVAEPCCGLSRSDELSSQRGSNYTNYTLSPAAPSSAPSNNWIG